MQLQFPMTRGLGSMLCAWACLHCAGTGLVPSEPGSSLVLQSWPAVAHGSPAPTPAAPAPLGLEVWATVHGTYVGPLHPEMVLHSGDRIGVRARTSSVADVYLLHCDARDALSIYPSAGAVRFTADQRVELPAIGKDLRLAGAPGHETLYVVASKRPLEHADPELEAALSNAHASPHPNDLAAAGARETPDPACGRQLETLLASSWADRSGESTRRRFAVRGVDTSDAFDAVARAFADGDDVVVLRFAYRHAP